MPVCGVSAEEPSPAGQSFSEILNRHVRQTFDEAARYVKTRPDAADADAAFQWLFETAREHGLEQRAVPLAEAYLQREQQVAATAANARRVRVLGLARAGKMEDALSGFERELRDVRLRAPNETVDFALALASEAQLAGEFAAARKCLEQTSSAFFLNPYVRELCDNRLAKLELAEQAAPETTVEDFDGKPVDLADYRGKVVLVDFWATNCAPCLKEFPMVKRLYAEYRPKGFEIVGITLDEQRETVERFQKKWKLPWRLALSSTDENATRRRYRAVTIPSTILLDGEGQVVGVDLRGRYLRRAVRRLLDSE